MHTCMIIVNQAESRDLLWKPSLQPGGMSAQTLLAAGPTSAHENVKMQAYL